MVKGHWFTHMAISSLVTGSMWATQLLRLQDSRQSHDSQVIDLLPTWALLECKAKKEGEGELIYSNGDRFKGQTDVVTVWFSHFPGNLFNEASGPMIEQLAMEFSSTPTEIGTKANGLMTSVRSSEARKCQKPLVKSWSAPQINKSLNQGHGRGVFACAEDSCSLRWCNWLTE